MFREACGASAAPWNHRSLSWALAAAGEPAAARAELVQLHQREENEYVWPIGIAAAYASLGQLDRGFEDLQRAYDERVGMDHVYVCAELRPIPGRSPLRRECEAGRRR